MSETFIVIIEKHTQCFSVTIEYYKNLTTIFNTSPYIYKIFTSSKAPINEQYHFILINPKMAAEIHRHSKVFQQMGILNIKRQIPIHFPWNKGWIQPHSVTVWLSCIFSFMLYYGGISYGGRIMGIMLGLLSILYLRYGIWGCFFLIYFYGDSDGEICFLFFVVNISAFSLLISGRY